MSQLEHLLQQCTVKLTLPGRSSWGTGFFVAPRWILTCAHVVKEAKGELIKVRWQNQENWAQAVVERSIADPYDLALLRVTLPIDAKPPCVYLDEEFSAGHTLYAYGYSDEFPEGASLLGECEGDATENNSRLILFKATRVRSGMSGSPLLNLQTKAICGIVKFTRDRSLDLGGGAIPSHVILEQFPQLRELQREFHGGDRRWSDAEARKIGGAVRAAFQKIFIFPKQKLDTLLSAYRNSFSETARTRLRILIVGSGVLSVVIIVIIVIVQSGLESYVQRKIESIETESSDSSTSNPKEDLKLAVEMGRIVSYFGVFKPIFVSEKIDKLVMEKLQISINKVSADSADNRPWKNYPDSNESDNGKVLNISINRRTSTMISSDHFGKFSIWEVNDKKLERGKDSSLNKKDFKFRIEAIEFNPLNPNILISLISPMHQDSKRIALFELEDGENVSSLSERNLHNFREECDLGDYKSLIATDSWGQSVGTIRQMNDKSEINIFPATPTANSCSPNKISIQDNDLETIEFWPRIEDEQPLIIAANSSKSLSFWCISCNQSNENEQPIKMTVERKSKREVEQVQVATTKFSFSPDGKLLAEVYKNSDDRNTIRLGRLSIKEQGSSTKIEINEIKTLPLTDLGITSITLTAIQKKYFLVMGYNDGYVRLWDVPQLNLLGRFKIHKNSVDTLEIYLEKQLLISGGWDGKISLLDLSVLTLDLKSLLSKACQILQEELKDCQS